ncbi:hypothetical protein ACFPK9_12440 [Rubritalea spongiae]|uniref:DUF4397 domain-containing protein n=1 Tax=Rubritalea spongiae TaxID=430797 RepID=A0ABW5E2L0_9BACT
MRIQYQHMFFSALCFFLLILVPSGVQAQNAKSARAFSLLSWEELPYDSVYYRNGSTMNKVKIKVGRRSESYPLPSDGKLEMFISEKDPEGKDKYKMIGQATIMQGAKKMLYVVVANKKASSLPLSMFGINDSIDVFPAGSFRFLNFTSVPIEGAFSGDVFRLQPGKTTVVKTKKLTGGSFHPFYLRTVKGVMLYETRLLGQPSGREIVFIMPPNNGSGRVNIKFLPQTVPRPEIGSNQ